VKQIRTEMATANVTDARFGRRFKVAKLEDLPAAQYQEAIGALKAEAARIVRGGVMGCSARGRPATP